MIGYIKIYFERVPDINALFKGGISINPFTTLIETPSGRMKYEYNAQHLNMKSTIKEESGWVIGSLQVSHNIMNEEFNYEDLTYSNLVKITDYLADKIVDVKHSSITNLEFGLNIIPNSTYSDILSINILMHKLNGYNHNKRSNIKGMLRHFEYTNFHIMIFNKAVQIDVSENVLRFELRLIRSVELKKLGIYTLLNLKDKDVLINLKNLFMEKFEELTIMDNFKDRIDIPDEIKTKLNDYVSPTYWLDLSKRFGRQTKSRHKKDFEKIQSDYNLNQMKEEIRNSLNMNFYKLYNN